MNIYAMYFSPTQTTQKVVLEIAKNIRKVLCQHILQLDFKEIDLTQPDARQDSYEMEKSDFLVIGLPVYAGRIPSLLEEVLGKIKGNETPAAAVVLFGNRDYDDALLELTRKLRKNGFITIAGGAFIGEHSYSQKIASDRPDEKDLQAAAEFAKKAATKFIEIKKGNPAEEVAVNGRFPYKENPPFAVYAPVTSDACTGCKTCAAGCPVKAISYDNPKAADENLCIHCCACVKTCPSKAKSFDNEMLMQRIAMLEQNFTQRKEPDIFI